MSCVTYRYRVAECDECGSVESMLVGSSPDASPPVCGRCVGARPFKHSEMPTLMTPFAAEYDANLKCVVTSRRQRDRLEQDAGLVNVQGMSSGEIERLVKPQWEVERDELRRMKPSDSRIRDAKVKAEALHGPLNMEASDG